MSALLVSFSVSWYSGANVAQTSMPYADHALRYSQTRASWIAPQVLPPAPVSPQVRFEAWKSDRKNGTIMNRISGTNSRPPVR